MNEIEGLYKAYKSFVQLPWDQTLAGPQKVWFALYEPAQERRLRLRIPNFADATRDAGHTWKLFDLTDTFARWMAYNKYHEAYFEEPEEMNLALHDFTDDLAQQIKNVLAGSDVDANTVVALLGLASLFGLTQASEVFQKVTPVIPGRLLAFFPGQHNGPVYRLLDARDGWNYLAVPISGIEGK
jgi:hypothetical protein